MAPADDSGDTRDHSPQSGPPGDGRRGSRGRARGGRGGRGGRGRGPRGREQQQHPPAAPAAEEEADPAQAGKLLKFKVKNAAQDAPADGDGDVEVCFICANPIQHHAVAPCNHVTCHICALRLRALYKNKDCPHCRVRLEPAGPALLSSV